MSKKLTCAEKIFNEGNRHLTAGDASKAKVCFLEAIRLVPDFAEAHTNLGLLLDQEGIQAEAEHHYRHSIIFNHFSGNTHLNLGVLLANQKRFEEAETHYRQAIALIPDSPVAWSD